MNLLQSVYDFVTLLQQTCNKSRQDTTAVRRALMQMAVTLITAAQMILLLLPDGRYKA